MRDRANLRGVGEVPPTGAEPDRGQDDTAGAGTGREKRPGGVAFGCLMAWIGAGVGILGGLSIGGLPANSELFAAFQDPDGAAHVLRIVGLLYAAWCLVVAWFAVLAFRGNRWAPRALLVMASVAVGLSLFAAVQGQLAALWSGVWASISALLINDIRPRRFR